MGIPDTHDAPFTHSHTIQTKTTTHTIHSNTDITHAYPVL